MLQFLYFIYQGICESINYLFDALLKLPYLSWYIDAYLLGYFLFSSTKKFLIQNK